MRDPDRNPEAAKRQSDREDEAERRRTVRSEDLAWRRGEATRNTRRFAIAAAATAAGAGSSTDEIYRLAEQFADWIDKT